MTRRAAGEILPPIFRKIIKKELEFSRKIVYNNHNVGKGENALHQEIYRKIVKRSMEPQNQEKTIQYLTEHLKKILRRQERVLICFGEYARGDLSWLMEQAVLRCGALPVVWGPDHRWKTLLRLAFSTKASTIIGEPLLALGLMKLMRVYTTPLYVRRFISAGYPSLSWMIQGIRQGFDCACDGCFSLGLSGVVAGFSCGRDREIHLWDSEYGVDILGDDGNLLPPGELGQIVLYPRERPELRLPMGEFARLVTESCACGCREPRLTDFHPGRTQDASLVAIGEELQKWTSVLDCRMRKGESGLEMEIVIFPGEKLPKLPQAAKLVVRPFDPETEEPFWYVPVLNVLGGNSQ